ncbi:MAG: ligase-associated DNA damage response endonuclease PdeM [Pseudomonadota bacterium]
MNRLGFKLGGEAVEALASGALWWPRQRLLAASDLHLGRAERQARLGGTLLPPYGTGDTLDRLEETIGTTDPDQVILVGDTFDDMAAADDLDASATERLLRLAAGRQWHWVTGNHDPAPVDLPGSHRDIVRIGGLEFRHIAKPDPVEGAEVSGHYHPKVRIRIRGSTIHRPCFLADRYRVILPAFGTYTGGLDSADPAFDRLLSADATAILTGPRPTALPRAMLEA